jgi:drug/metabolite transporter (DMT)-like permease
LEQNLIGEVSAIGAAIFWSISPYIFSVVVTRIGSFNLNLSRLCVSSVLLLSVAFAFGISLSVPMLQLVYLILSGIIGLVFGDTFLFKSLKEIGPRYTMILMSSNPAMGAIIAFFAFGEKISLVGILGMFVTFSGIVLVVFQQDGKEVSKYKPTFAGILFGFLSALGQAVGLIFTKLAYFVNPIHPFSAAFYRIFPSFLILLGIGIATGRLSSELPKMLKRNNTYLLVILGSIIGPFSGIILSFIAVTHIQVGIAATIMSLQPVLMLPISKYLQKERLSVQSIVGAFLSVAGIALLFLR